MFSVVERIMYFGSKPQPKAESKTSIYDERIKCFQTLTHLQKQIKFADEQTSNENTLQALDTYTKEYRKEYELCEIIMKYK
jgi:hypothetical protein